MLKRLSLLALLLISSAQAAITCSNSSPLFQAAALGDLSVVEQYQKKGCQVNMQNARGFRLYDIAVLNGQDKVAKWLVNKNLAKNNQYATSTIKLVQTGMRFLNIDAGIINGKMTPQIEKAIKTYQQKIKHSPSGKLSAGWLPFFYKDLIKKMQDNFNDLGYDIGKPDGKIGENTRKAMRQFREKNKIVDTHYPFIDDQLIYQLMLAENEVMKKQIQRRKEQKEQENKRRQQEIAEQRAQEKARLAKEEAKRREQEAQELAEQEAMKRELEASKAQGEKALREAQAVEQKLKQPLIKRPEAVEVAKSEAKTSPKVTPKVSEKPAVTQSKPVTKKASSDVTTSTQKQTTPVVRKSVATSSTAQSEQSRVAQQAQARIDKKAVFKKLSGKLEFNGGQCKVGGQSIDNTWCQGNSSEINRQCDVVLTHSGTVVSLLCK